MKQKLTPRGAQVLLLARSGMSTRQIAERLGIAPSSVRNHKVTTRIRLGCDSWAEAVYTAAAPPPAAKCANPRCDELVPESRRTNAVYCSVRCNNMTFRNRRLANLASLPVGESGLSASQSEYVKRFEQRLRTGEGIDICMMIAERIGHRNQGGKHSAGGVQLQRGGEGSVSFRIP